MANEIEKLKDHHEDLMMRSQFDDCKLDYSIVDKYITMLEKLDEIEGSSYEIVDLNKREHIFISRKFETLFGYNVDDALEQGGDYLTERIHPDDLASVYKIGDFYFRQYLEGKIEDGENVKFIIEFRLRREDNEYVRVTKQYRPLEFAPNGKLWLALAVINISSDSDLNAPVRSKLINLRTGESFYFYQNELDKMWVSPISEREIQILELIAKGLSSKLIADKLFISVNTVNTHRQRIIEKLEVSNTAEAVNKAKDLGLMG